MERLEEGGVLWEGIRREGEGHGEVRRGERIMRGVRRGGEGHERG